MENIINDNGLQNNKISFIDFFAVLLQWKFLIIGITTVSLLGVISASIISLKLPPEKSFLPNEYSPKAYMLINDSSSAGGGLSSMLNSSGLGGFAALAGVSSGSSYSKLAVYLTGMNNFLDTVVDEFDLLKRYKVKKFQRAESRDILKKKFDVQFDDASGVFSIGFTDIDPVFAQSVVNFSVGYLEKRFDEMGLDKNKREKENLEINIGNTFKDIQRLELESRNLEQSVSRGSMAMNIPSIMLEINRITLELEAQKQVYSQLKVQHEMLKIAMASETPIFQILELAEIPDRKSKPSRGMLCLIVTFAAGFFSVFLAFLFDAVASVKKDPEAMRKLKGLKT